VQACVLQSCDAYWLPTPFSCFPFTSPVRHRVPSHFNWALTTYPMTVYNIPEDLNLVQYHYTNAKSCTDRA